MDDASDRRVLILMRHAKSDWSQPNTSDHDRALNARGRRTAPAMAHHLEQHQLSPQVILASTATRVQQTLTLMRETQWAREANVVNRKALYLASAQQLGDAVESLHDQHNVAMLIGHNPGMQVFASRLAEQDLEMPTAAITILHCNYLSWGNCLADADWELFAHWKPKEMDGAEL